MLKLSLCRIKDIKEFPMGTGLTVNAEGLGLCSSLVSGVETAKFYTTGTDRFLGFTYGENLTPVTKSKVEDVVCPATSPYTVTLSKTNIVADQYNLYNVTSGSAITKDTGYSLATTTGIITFTDSDLYGCTIRATYKYTPTVAEVLAEDRMSLLQKTATDVLSQIGVILGSGGDVEVYTDQFDAATDWNAATGLKVGADGVVYNQAGTGIAVPNGVVCFVPTPDVPFLGIRF